MDSKKLRILLIVICLILIWIQQILDRREIVDIDESLLNSGDSFSKTTTFQFPTISERIQYYMGSWGENRHLNPDSIDAKFCQHFYAIDPKSYGPDLGSWFENKPLLYSYATLESEVQNTTSKTSLKYLGDALKVIQAPATDNSTQRRDVPNKLRSALAIQVGDSTTANQQDTPLIVKARHAGFLTSSKTKRDKTYYPIIWPLEMKRHFTRAFDTFDLDQDDISWEEKLPSLIWRGNPTGNLHIPFSNRPRVHAVERFCHNSLNVSSNIDIAFSDTDFESKEDDPLSKLDWNATDCVRDKKSKKDQLKSKYILSIEGNDVASGLKWQLYSNSVVFMTKPSAVSFAMEECLVPFVHYVPVKDDYSNLEEMIDWAKNNDDKAEWISQQSTQYMKDLWMSEEAQRNNEFIMNRLGSIYQEKFASLLYKCISHDLILPKESVRNL